MLQGDWYIFVNGKALDTFGNDWDYALKSGDSVAFVFGTDELPDLDEVVRSTPPRNVRTGRPIGLAIRRARPAQLRPPTSSRIRGPLTGSNTPARNLYSNASEPIIVNGYIYLAVDKQLLKIDAATGVKLAQAPLAGSIGYTTRPVYAQGVIMVPLDGGAVQALTADTLTTVWLHRRSQLEGPV
ncbi:MAG: hypothetical protein V8T51_01500 [Senegalimassilia faecalis]